MGFETTADVIKPAGSLVLHLEDAAYRKHPALARSSLDHIMVSPAHFQRSLTEPRADTAAFRLGRLVHSAVLEPDKFWPTVALFEGARRFGKVWDAFKVKHAHKTILSVTEHDQLKAVAQAVKNLGMDLQGHVESSIFWRHERTGVDLKARLDLIVGPVVFDLKTTSDLEAFDIYEHGYHRQGAWYLDAAHAAGLAPTEFVFLVVEKKSPHRVVTRRLLAREVERGHAENERNLTLYKSCLDANHWPEKERDNYMSETNVTTIQSAHTIIKGKKKAPWAALIYGTAGLGKSTWAAEAPNPYFLDMENRLAEVGPDRSPVIMTPDDLKREITFAANSNYQTIVFDTADAMEKILIAKILANHEGKESLADFGYGKGEVYLRSEWAKVIELVLLLKNKGKNVIFTAHDIVQRIDDPTTDSYDRYTINLEKKAAPALVAVMDAVLFARFEIFVRPRDEDKKSSKGRASGSGKRIVYTVEQPFCVAKNSYGLPSIVPLTSKLFACFSGESTKPETNVNNEEAK